MRSAYPMRRHSRLHRDHRSHHKKRKTVMIIDEYDLPMCENIPSRELEGYIGFTKDEVGSICAKYDTSYEECTAWYNGYELNGVSICDPKSIVEATLTKEFAGHIARRNQLRQKASNTSAQ